MALFDQRGQHVHGDQYNAQYMHFGAIQSTADFLTALEALQNDVTSAKEAGVLNEATATEAHLHVEEATQEAQKSTPDKKTIRDHLITAKNLIEGITLQ